MDPYELAKTIHDRITKTQTAASVGTDRKYLSWEELKHPGFKGKYDSYIEGFVAAVKELVTDPLSIKSTLQEIVPVGQTRRLFVSTKSCYHCNHPFKPEVSDQFLCERCALNLWS